MLQMQTRRNVAKEEEKSHKKRGGKRGEQVNKHIKLDFLHIV